MTDDELDTHLQGILALTWGPQNYLTGEARDRLRLAIDSAVRSERERLKRAEELLRPFATWLTEYGEENIAVNAIESYKAAAAFLAEYDKPLNGGGA